MSEWLDSAAVPSAIIGGVAASVLGRPRLTEDIDVLAILERRKWTPFLGAGQEFGFAPRIDDGGASRVSYARAGPGGIGPVGG